jgi:phosphatidylglycerol---prolipoprotein diacylglyceryl transferase
VRTPRTTSGIPAGLHLGMKAEKPERQRGNDAEPATVRCRVPVMSFPVYLHFGVLRIHPHWLFETLAYVVSFRIYLLLRRHQGDAVPDADRWWVIAAAAMGATLGSKLLYWLEDPLATLGHIGDAVFLLGGKTIVGALVGALFAVEATKKSLGINRRTGDLFAVPLCVGIAIGRVGCFLTGLDDHTAGVATSLPWGVNFGDGVPRHPTQLYEIAFALLLAGLIVAVSRRPHGEGDLFKIFMVGYLAFRLSVDLLKPKVPLAGLSSIQWACILMLLYYAPDVRRWLGGVRGFPRSGPAQLEAPRSASAE